MPGGNPEGRYDGSWPNMAPGYIITGKKQPIHRTNVKEMEQDMQIKQFRYSADNFSYLLHGNRSAMAIDPGAVESILSYVKESHLHLQYVTNTHMHPDHVAGNREILERTDADFLDNQTLRKQKTILLDDEEIEIFHTPGHTEDSLIFHVDKPYHFRRYPV